MEELYQRLNEYRTKQKINSKGKLAVVLFITRLAREKGLPLDPARLTTDQKGQVQGLGKSSVQKILSEYGITRVLAEEGGRTSRGSLGASIDYVRFLNSLHQDGLAQPEAIEKWWVERVQDYFASQPFTLKFDVGHSLRTMVRDILAQAAKRQKEGNGAMYVGAVLQHLVGAKLRLAFPDLPIEVHGFSVADSPTARSGDFLIADGAVHVSTAPSEALIRKCKANLETGLKPIIVTVSKGTTVAEGLAEQQGIENRIDIWDAEQFISANLHEISSFQASQYRETVANLIEIYNPIIEECETDHSLKIQMG